MKKYKQKYKSKRLDLRKGGRVGYAEGDVVTLNNEEEEYDKNVARDERIKDTADTTVQAAQGQVPETAQLPSAEQVGFQRDEAGNILYDDAGNALKVQEQQTSEMATPTAATAETAKVDETMTEADKVSTGTATTTASDKTGTAATYTAETVADKDVAVDAAQGKLSEESSAKLEEIRQLTEPFKYAQIEKKCC